MARYKHFLDQDVLTAAKERMHHVFDIFDTIVCMFSGGKDSLAALHLTQIVHAERGLTTPINVVFRDEELIQQSVIDFVNEYRVLPWVNMKYFCYPLRSTMFVLGAISEYVQWDPKREHLRPIPEYAIVPPAGAATEVFDQYSMDAEIAKHFKGKIAFVNGIRAAESLTRYRSCVNKLNENYINASSAKNVSMVKPIYDWQENDLFKFFDDHRIRYCPHYDSQMWAGQALRVATPLIPEGAKNFGKLRETCPEFYNRVITLFPEMLIQERYWRDMDRKAVVERYGQSLDGVRAWIEEHIIDEAMLKKALWRLDGVVGRERVQPGSYPADYVLKAFMTGSFKRNEIMPVGRKQGTSAK